MNTPSFIKKILATVAVIASLIAPLPGALLPTANADSTDNVYGYAWAGQKDADGNVLGVGYIKLNNCDAPKAACTATPYGVTIPKGSAGSTTTITGTAWSPNIGWISFDQGAMPTGTCPDGSACTATATWAANGSAVIKGWARACAVFTTDCDASKGFRVDADLGSWDGWIALTNPDGGTWPGATSGWVINAPDATGVSKMAGFAWGSDVVGWVDFSNAYIKDPSDFCANLTDVPLLPTGATQSDSAGVASVTGTYCDFCPLQVGVQNSADSCTPPPNNCVITPTDPGNYCPSKKPATVDISWVTNGVGCTLDGVAFNGTSTTVSTSTTHTVVCYKDASKAQSCEATFAVGDTNSCTGGDDTCADGSLKTSHPNNICPEDDPKNYCKDGSLRSSHPNNKCPEDPIICTPASPGYINTPGPDFGKCTCPTGTELKPNPESGGWMCVKKKPIIIEF